MNLHIYTSTTPTLQGVDHNGSLKIRSAGIDWHLDWKIGNLPDTFGIGALKLVER